jgi:hypothetical protein
MLEVEAPLPCSEQIKVAQPHPVHGNQHMPLLMQPAFVQPAMSHQHL